MQDVEPFAVQQVADAGDIACNPFDISEAVRQIDEGARALVDTGAKLMTIGGDHTIALPLLRVMHEVHGPVAVVHFDAHLDTWDTYFGAPVTHGTPFRRASEEGLIDKTGSMHVGIRGPLYSSEDLADDQVLGFQVIGAHDMDDLGWRGAVERIKARVGDRPTYVSLDIDVLDPSFAPGTGTPEAGGLTSRELLNILRAFADLNLVGADIVEVAPAYDHAEVTGIAASHAAYELDQRHGAPEAAGCLSRSPVARPSSTRWWPTVSRTSSASPGRTTSSCTGTCRPPASGTSSPGTSRARGMPLTGTPGSAAGPGCSSPPRARGSPTL